MKERHADSAVVIGEITIIPLKEINMYYVNNTDNLSVYVSSEPIGIVINSPQGKWAIDIQGNQVPLETYIQKIHGLKQILENL
ncbi:hypothetical protein ACFLTQ_01610 [Chloroflexota bacterium]